MAQALSSLVLVIIFITQNRESRFQKLETEIFGFFILQAYKN